MNDKSTITSRKSHNVRGRPTSQKEIKFSAQPKSIVSEMLNKIRSERNHIKKVLNKDDITYSNSPPLEECNKSNSNLRYKVNKADISHVGGKLFSCDYKDCNYNCKLSSNLIKHKRIHTNDRPYLCDQCPFRTNFINSLKVHKRTHTCEKPYPCKHCNYRCNSSSNLKKHCLHRHPEVIKGN